MIIKLNVWVELPNGEILKAGELAVKEPDTRGALQGQFRYTQEYLEAPEAFSLDPLHLPLAAELFDADRPRAGVHGVFEDSLPDDWGRRLMARRYKLDRTEQRVPQLLQFLGNQGLGALTYADREMPSPFSDGVSCIHLEELSLMAEKFENSPTIISDDELSMLFQAGSSPGGARPKALVADQSGFYIAKFASTRDQLDMVSLEAAAMELAHRAGIDTARTKLLPLGSRKCLLVERFDVNKSGGRNHLISMQTLLKADGYYYAGYRDLADVIKHISATPQRDLHMLFRQMVFNVLIGNTDDHLKNFCMMHDDEGWRLSPAFDLAPNIGFNLEHVLRIGMSNKQPDLETLLTEAKYFGIKRREPALDIIVNIHNVVSTWESVFTACEVPSKDAETIGVDINQRLKKTLFLG
jgi:serine/threonine-protein kinase HipA